LFFRISSSGFSFAFDWQIMGIHNLAKLIADQAPGSIKEGEIKNYFGRKIAIDA